MRILGGERALTFIIGVLLCLGIIVYVIYTAIGFAVLPVLCMKYRPNLTALELDDTRVALQLNREKQRMIESRYEGTSIQWSTRDRRAYEVLQREELTLVRRVHANAGYPRWWRPRWLVKSFRFVARPVVIIIGFFLMLIALVIIASILISMYVFDRWLNASWAIYLPDEIGLIILRIPRAGDIVDSYCRQRTLSTRSTSFFGLHLE